MGYDKAVRIQKINEAIRHLFEQPNTSGGKYWAFNKQTGELYKTDSPGGDRVFGIGDDGDLSRAKTAGGEYLNRPSYNKPLVKFTNVNQIGQPAQAAAGRPDNIPGVNPFGLQNPNIPAPPAPPAPPSNINAPRIRPAPGRADVRVEPLPDVAVGSPEAKAMEHPSMLPADQLAPKTGQTPAQVEAQRALNAANKQALDAARPAGQPPSFTPSGESPAPGRRADGTAVPPPPATTRGEPMTTPEAGYNLFGVGDFVRNLLGTSNPESYNRFVRGSDNFGDTFGSVGPGNVPPRSGPKPTEIKRGKFGLLEPVYAMESYLKQIAKTGKTMKSKGDKIR